MMAVGFAWARSALPQGRQSDASLASSLDSMAAQGAAAAAADGGARAECRTATLWNRAGEEVSLAALPACSHGHVRVVRIGFPGARKCHVRGCGCADPVCTEARQIREAPCVD